MTAPRVQKERLPDAAPETPEAWRTAPHSLPCTGSPAPHRSSPTRLCATRGGATCRPSAASRWRHARP
eukprot:scaffold19920_cov61-Phaeocystis_antarctica.AAC.3